VDIDEDMNHKIIQVGHMRLGCTQQPTAC
jgi:hypothetical protein